MRRRTIHFILIILICLHTAAFADDKEDSKKYYEQGKTEYDAGNIDAALPLLEKSYDLDNRNFKAQKLLAECLNTKGKALIQAGSFDPALDIYKKAYKIWPNNAEIKATYDGLKNGTIQADYADKIAAQTTAEPVIPTVEPDKQEEIKTKLNEAEKTLTEISKTDTTVKESTTTGQTTEEKALQAELEKQKQLIAKMKSDYENLKSSDTQTPEILKGDSEKVDELLFMYQQMLEEKKSESTGSDMSQFIEVMQQYRKDLDKQSISPLGIVLIAGGSSVVLIVVLLIVLLFLAKIQSRKRARRMQENANNRQQYSAGGLSAPSSQQYGAKEEPTFLLGYDGSDQSTAEQVQPAEEVSDEMYKDLLKYEKLKKMHTQMKSGNLNWDTVRDNIDILHNELQAEILKIIEMKISCGEVEDYSQVLPVLFPFLVSGNDYMRKKSNVLAYKVLESEKRKIDAEVSAIENEEKTHAELKDLSDTKLLIKYAEQLDQLVGKKDHSINVANYAKRIGLMIGLDKAMIDLLYKAGLVHDFGYFLFSEAFCNEMKHASQMDEEFIKTRALHPEKGIEYFKLKHIEIPGEIKEAILYHHERNDSSGYAKGLKGDEIPVFAKIIAVADVFEALMGDRPFREKMNFNSASILMKDLGRNKLDYTYINAFIEFFKKV